MTTAGSGDVGASVRLRSAPLVKDLGLEIRPRMSGGPGHSGGGTFSPKVLRRRLLLVGEVGPDTGYVEEPAEIRPVRIVELKSLYVEGGSGGIGSVPVAGFLAWVGDRMAGRVSATACASDGAAVRFYGCVGFRPKTVALEMAL